jgi:putative addiction module killer protein
VDAIPRELEFYATSSGRVPAREWLDAREGTDEYGAVMVRLERVRQGNFGDHRSVGDGVSELKFRSGCRVYYGLNGRHLVILLVIGSKQTQVQDIKTAKRYWEDFNA